MPQLGYNPGPGAKRNVNIWKYLLCTLHLDKYGNISFS